MNRREFIASGFVAVVFASRSNAQQIRRIGALFSLSFEDPEGQRRLAAFQRGLRDLGWVEGQNITYDLRSGAYDIRSGESQSARYRRFADELVRLSPDVILAVGSVSVQSLQRQTQTIPIVFVSVIDPVGAGFVESMARPGGNTTGFTTFEYGMGAKWIELLQEIAPDVKRVAVLRDPTIAAGSGLFGAMQSAASSLGLEVKPIGLPSEEEMKRALSAFSAAGKAGLVVETGAWVVVHRAFITRVAANLKMPAIYGYDMFVSAGGLLSYGPDNTEQYYRAAGYVDRILKGTKAGDLPLQAPTKYELAVNVKAAKALGLAVPQTLLAAADKVVE